MPSLNAVPTSGPDHEPLWVTRIIEFLRENARRLDEHEHMQLVFNRAGDQVQVDYSIRSIKIR